VIHPVEPTRDRLLDAAEALFAERGYEAVGIREIAERAGVNLSGIKYHFGSKRGLYLASVERTVDRRGSRRAWALLDRPVSTRVEAAAALREFVTAFLRVLLQEGEADSCACVIMQAAMEPGDATDLVVREFIAPHHEQLTRLVGLLRPSADAPARGRLAQSVMGVLLHQRVFRPFLDRLGQRVGPGGGIEVDQLADELTGFVLRGLGCGDLTTREPGAGEAARAGMGAMV
jgi:AcrR family transcriptional regulator